jgi:hypothetical protein
MSIATNPMVEKLKTMTTPSFKLPKVFNSAGFEKVKGGLTAVTLATGYNNTDDITKVMIILMAFLFFIIFFWCYTKLSLDEANCKTITKLYDDFPLIRSINPDNPIYGYKLRDYYIKSAYNCCSAGIFKNDFVNLCALKSCIKQGARCLDFEIYSVNNEPVIAISSKVNFNEKGSYNSIPFSAAMTVISTYAFSGSTAPNANDPLILHFRIMSNISAIHDQMATILYNTLQDRMLGKKFSFENGGTHGALNLGGYQLSLLMGKVVIMVDKSNPLFTSTRLYEYVNIASNAPFVRSLRYSDVKYSPDTTELTSYNKQNMSIVLPDVTSQNDNFSPSLAMAYGCQMIALSFQNFDSNMEYYTKMFDDAGSAFILKDDKYRYTPIFIPIPEPPPAEWAYAPRTMPVLPGIPDMIL